MIEHYQANVVWIGRRKCDSAITAKIDGLAQLGHAPIYISADATSLDSLEHAYKTILRTYGAIHGVVHSALVLRDRSIACMEEPDFRAGLSAKVDVSVNLDRVFGKQDLDFILFFSSVISFFKLPGQSNYSAGCTFSDSFAHKLRRERGYPVKIVNWGYWGDVGAVASEAYQKMTQRIGIGSIESQKAMASLQTFVNSEMPQIGFLKTANRQVTEDLIANAIADYSSTATRNLPHVQPVIGKENPDDAVPQSASNGGSSQPAPSTSRNPEAFVTLSDGDIVVSSAEIAKLRNGPLTTEFETWCAKALFQQIKDLIASAGQRPPLAISSLAAACGIKAKYRQWWNEALAILCDNKYFEVQDGILTETRADDATVVTDPRQLQKERFSRDLDTQALAALVSDCLERLPDILQGRILATDVIFPNSSMDKVERIYRNSPLPDMFNGVLADAVVAYVRRRLYADPHTRLRILEIGAGTGGTSAIVFAKLQPFRRSIEEYCYTDVSQAFFGYAEANYIPEYPYVQCRRLDIEQPAGDQGIDTGGYDVVIAANVLHTTKDIRQTIRNAKSILRVGGFLITNEISAKSVYAHLTFGLLDGWWRFEDDDLRILNCPGLWPATWRQLLEAEGFRSVQFPAKEAHDLGYQTIVAQSDGVIRPINAESYAPVQPASMKAAVHIEKRASQRSPHQNAEEYVRSNVLECLSSVAKIEPDRIDADVAFSDYGLDSILGIKFVEGINQRLSLGLNTAIIFEHSSLARLAQYVMETYRQQIETSLAQQGPSPFEKREVCAAPVPGVMHIRRDPFSGRRLRNRNTTKEKAKSREIAVIGMSGMFPGAENVHEFWKNLIAGADGIEELPAHYLDQKRLYSTKKQSGKTRCKWGGILKERDCFDPLFFNISPQEAESMNPHQRLILQEGWKAIEDAGYNPKALSGSPTGIFIGAEPTGYMGETFTGYSDAIIASRLSYFLNLTGPALVVNTGCSSSGVALHLACKSLSNGETDLALAGGVHACMNERVQISLDEIGMLSPTGRCRTFDGAADGTVISEAVALVVLKRLEDAVRDRDLIYGVISGSGINQDGASNGITAPNGTAQERLIASVYETFGIDPEQITYVETHGTGTKLGDPVEANALVRAFRKFTAKAEYCAVGSAKSHIGHTGATAGATGLIKVLMSLQHSRIPQLLHFQTLNPLVDFGGSPFHIPTEGLDWKADNGSPRMAALNSFGHSGTNAHIVIREYLETTDYGTPNTGRVNDPVILPLSARTIEQLRQRAADLLAFVQAADETSEHRWQKLDLVRVGYTLQVGRQPMEERLGFIVDSVDQLSEKLQLFLDGNGPIDGMHHGHAKGQGVLTDLFTPIDLQETVNKWIRNGEPSRLVKAWVNGLDMDWNVLYGGVKPRRLRLPVYPFAKEHYWAERTVSRKSSDDIVSVNGDSIEDIIDKIDEGLMDPDEAIGRLRVLV